MPHFQKRLRVYILQDLDMLHRNRYRQNEAKNQPKATNIILNNLATAGADAKC